MNRSLLSAKRRGFTLIELLVVVLIIGILAALIVPRVVNKASDAKVTAAKTDIASLKTELANFHVDCDRYPTQDEGLAALHTMPSGLDGKWHGPYDDKDSFPDPWGNAYIYKYPGTGGDDSFILESYGADGAEGGTGYNTDIIDGSGN